MPVRPEQARWLGRLGATVVVLVVSGTVSLAGAAWVPTDANSGNSFATAPHFPTISLAPTIGLQGAPIVVSGSGFAPSSTLSVTFGGSATAWTSGGGTVTTNGSGAIPALSTIAAGSQGPGTYVVRVTDALGDYATASFQLLS
jgi:hypothetical protein